MKHLATCLLLALTVLGCAGNRTITYQGEPVDETTAKVANRLYNLETALVLAGETALAARRHISDEDWDRLADLSDQANRALAEARGILIEYRQVRDEATATRLERAMVVLDGIVAAVLRYATALESGEPVLGTLAPVGG